MKKSFKTIVGISLLCTGIFSVSNINNHKNVNAAHAVNYETRVDTFSIYDFPENMNTVAKDYDLIGSESENQYRIVTQRGAGIKIVDLNEQTKSFVFKSGTDPYGLVSTSEIGYIKSVEVEFYISSGTGAYPELCIYASDTPYESPQDILFGRDEDIRATLDKNILKYNFEDDFKFLGIRSPKKSTASTSYIKSLKIEWELHDFSKTADISTNFGDGINIGIGQTFQIHASAIGDGEYTDNTIIYKSSNSNVFTVDQNGLITGIGSGTAKIRVQYGTSYVESEVTIKAFNEITLDISSTATRVERTSDLHEGDIIYIVYEPGGKVISDVISSEGKVGRYVNCNINQTTHTLEACNGGEYFYVYGNEETGFSFISTCGEIISFENDESWIGLASSFPSNKWNVSIENGNASIVNRDNKDINLTFDIYYDCFDAMKLDGEVAIYKFGNSGSNKITLHDTKNVDESYALLFAQKFLNVFGNICDLNGNTNVDALTEKWADIFVTPCDEVNNLNEMSLLMFKNAEANPNGDSIQEMISLYEYIIGKYSELADYNYLNRAVASSSAKIIPNIFNNEDDDSIICILMLGSLTFLTSTFLVIKKKKQVQ